MAQKTCPYCGAPVDPNRSACPNCRKVLATKSLLTPYIVIGILIVVIVVIVAVLLMNLAQGPAETSSLPTTVTPVPAAGGVAIPTQPPCTIAVSGSRASAASIRLQVMSGTCSSGDISSFQVSINGAAGKGTLGTSPGASATFAAPASSSIVVTAKFANGAESVVYQNPAL
jgi:predicted nucleic acid-binding Zn ribbon protein